MGIELKNILSLDCFLGAQVVAGKRGLNAAVHLVNVMEVPDIDNWVGEYELILTTGYPFRDDPTILASLIRRLHAKKVTGLAIKFNRYIVSLPKEVSDIADELDFPIIALTADARFDHIIKATLFHIIHDDYFEMKNTTQYSKQLQEMALKGCSIKQLLQEISEVCAGDVVLKTPEGVILEQYLLIDTSKYDNVNVSTYEKHVILDGKTYAVLSLIVLQKSIARANIEFINSAIPSIIMLFLQSSLAENIKKKDDVLQNLILGRTNFSAHHVEYINSLGVDLTCPYAVCVLTASRLMRDDYQLLHKTISSVLDSRSGLSMSGMIATKMENCIVHLHKITQQDTLEELKIFYMQISDKAANLLPDMPFNVGIGKFSGKPGHINQGFLEAKKAIKIGERLYGKTGVYCYDYLAMESILSNLTPDKEIGDFIEQHLGKLIIYDQKKNKQLLVTLEQLLISHNMREISEKMYIHSKTLLYRKKKIESILNVSMDDPRIRIQLTFAMKLYRIHYASKPENSNI